MIELDEIRHEYETNFPELTNKIRYGIRDVRGLASVIDALYSLNVIFRATAMKQFPNYEFFPLKEIKKNKPGKII